MSPSACKSEFRATNKIKTAYKIKCLFVVGDVADPKLPNIVVSEKSFTRLNSWLRSFDIVVEEINYKEISKQGGLLRCSTLPLIRE